MRKKLIVLFALLGFVILSCEKDDICASTTPTTPRLVIEFYNQASPAELKNVTNLDVISDLPDVDTLTFNNISTIQIPLMTTENTTTYKFVLNADNANPALVFTDELEFNYVRNDVFVSRACGYKTLFDLNNDDDPATPEAIILNGIPNDNSGTWIKNIVIEDYNLQNETEEIHVKVYF